MAIAIIAVMLLLPAVQRVEDVAASLRKTNVLKTPLIDWGDGAAQIREDMAMVVTAALQGGSTSNGTFAAVCTNLGKYSSAATALVTRIQNTSARQLPAVQRQRLTSALTDYENGAKQLAAAISTATPGAPCNLP